jgi:hypothetical protein
MDSRHLANTAGKRLSQAFRTARRLAQVASPGLRRRVRPGLPKIPRHESPRPQQRIQYDLQIVIVDEFEAEENALPFFDPAQAPVVRAT